jgi:hypothetical protein
MSLDSIPPSETSVADALDQARLKLRPPVQTERTWPAIAAAFFFAIAALGFATASVLAPPLNLTPASRTSVR